MEPETCKNIQETLPSSITAVWNIRKYQLITSLYFLRFYTYLFNSFIIKYIFVFFKNDYYS